jgi:acetyl-CoA C-acetyltransferase
MPTLAAVVGMGQTHHKSKRDDVSMAGLVRESADDALRDANLDWKDIDAVILGKAPDMFEGVMMPELYLSDALVANGKPIIRVHTAGSVGGATGIVAASYIQSGLFNRVLVATYEKQSESNAMWALSTTVPYAPLINAGAGGYFTPYMREYKRRHKAPDNIGRLVAVKDRLNALKNPKAHLHIEGINEEMVEQSPILWDPLTFLESCPSSDGACSLIISSEDSVDSNQTPAWILGTSVRSEPTMYVGRDVVNPIAGTECAKDVYHQAGILDPRKEIDCAEIYVPFSWYEPMWLENLLLADIGKGWMMSENGDTSLEGSFPVNMSGGVLSSNPIGASGLIRFGEAAQQVRQKAGDYQVSNANIALGHAFGGGAQFFAMWIVASKKP